MERIFIDTSGWYALLNKNEPENERVAHFLQTNPLQLVTSNFIITELMNLLVARRQKTTALSFGKTLREKQELSIFRVEPGDEDEAWKIFEKFRDKDYSFTDCTSFALMRRLKISKVLALDDDFRSFGFQLIP